MTQDAVELGLDLVDIQMERQYVKLLMDNIANNYTVRGLEGATALLKIYNALNNALDTDGA
jgi:hypothetical protein|tara:strand:+ start:985 stop:1167 length:183 start_codon:yes stop_codon:yes gene_type:complete